MELETTESGSQATRPQPGPAPPPDRRARAAPTVVQGAAKPWQFDTRKAAPRPAAAPTAGPSLDAAARSYLGLDHRLDNPLGGEAPGHRQVSIAGERDAAEVLRQIHLANPVEASRVARGLSSLPEPGQIFLGFRLIDELGRGAFGRVYLAQQGDLADRYVALKVSTELKGESQTLAQLQHTNIVPIFSVHYADPFHAVCMPYYGVTTLKDVCDDLEKSGVTPASGRSLLKNLSTRRSSARAAISSAAHGRTAPTARDVPASPATKAGDGPESAGVETTPEPEPKPGPSSNTLRMLGELPFDEAVLWMGCRLADGLAHAHERGILHRDLKPANILLTDDGQPMLLDFNLSHDTHSVGVVTAAVGGTLPYMAPEHLEAFRGEDRVVDARSDLYALGIILFELLSGRHPFPIHDDSTPETLDQMIAERQGPPPMIRPWNPGISPAAESIIRHCLEPEPARRYQSVRDLHEDLERHLADLPLKYAPEPSIRQRFRKFLRRNPRACPLAGIGLAIVVLVTATVALTARDRRLARLEASKNLEAFRDDLGMARYVLSVRSDDRAERDRGSDLGRVALGHYKVLEDPAWMDSAAVSSLPPVDRDRLRGEVGEALSMLAQAAALDVSDRPDPATRARRVEAGLALTGLAMTCFGEEKAPHSLLGQRAELMALLERPAAAKALEVRAEQAPMTTSRDFLMAANEHLVKGEVDRALPLAAEATRRDPGRFWAWFTLGVCQDRLERPAPAIACFQTCVALRPENPYAWFNRGVCLLRNGKPELARGDFDRAIGLKPEWHEPYLNRAIARRDLGDFRGAADDLTLALSRGATETRIYFLRAAALARAGDAEGARKDRLTGLAKVPTDSESWIARGLERMGDDPAGALSDFEQASGLAPNSLQAMHMRAHVLAMSLGRLVDAAALLDRAIAIYPDYVAARGFRGVIRARQGRRDEAHRDAQEARWLDNSPPNLYQLAGIYATTSRQVPEDCSEAYHLLHAALRHGFGFDLIADDVDLDAIRDKPEFRRLVESARLARKQKAPVPAKP